jgi:hypothetical protein
MTLSILPQTRKELSDSAKPFHAKRTGKPDWLNGKQMKFIGAGSELTFLRASEAI